MGNVKNLMVKFLEDPMRHRGNVYFTDMEVRIHFLYRDVLFSSCTCTIRTPVQLFQLIEWKNTTL